MRDPSPEDKQISVSMMKGEEVVEEPDHREKGEVQIDREREVNRLVDKEAYHLSNKTCFMVTDVQSFLREVVQEDQEFGARAITMMIEPMIVIYVMNP